MEAHPLAELFLMLEPDDLDALSENIKANRLALGSAFSGQTRQSRVLAWKGIVPSSRTRPLLVNG